MPVTSVGRFEHFFRAAAGLDIDKADLKRYTDFINLKLYALPERRLLLPVPG